MLKIDDIRDLIRLLDESSLTELRIETEDMKLCLKKALTAPVTPPAAAAAAVAPPPAAAASFLPSPEAAAAPAADPAPPAGPAGPAPVQEANIHTITSPMVGTFYRAPSPDAPPYVDVGSRVTEKTVVCIVEAMKLMNEIEAECRGEIIEVLAENGQLVEYGQPLFRVRLG
ncbi:biotin carboxyl carrier protein of acetyl-CoA carboxylase [Alicyclobacillus cellulosilyticus]|uniref:Biotin carboxyl carrier protein of acetyl-CoA carboxylase n=1 Tax=Alicyclobacillus cellulosilyticus TaxID=1003997 RepID=A0A917K0D2_9BACL|nr:acetyl-CoA carboxylase biotin carboxyl carrier protein [Alicyclobacillus cellulosilyticus]GGI95948.1 biotin carboxyl carrier protein of acetyl-CoA carboxylase [Alicyclobacillus cellulosilyticus]